MRSHRTRLALLLGLLLPLGLLLGILSPHLASSQAAAPALAVKADLPRAAPNQPGLPADWVKAFTWRAIGPCNMSGRIVAMSVFEADPTTWWAATASGGLLKTTNNGYTLEHQFDREATVCIGDVCVAPSNRDIVWVGTGENNPRNSVSYGDGVYKSTNGGKTWKNMGLKKSFQIGKIAIHPKNHDIVYVGALGRLYGPNEERGVFKTADGGKTWDRVLYIDDKTGIIDLAMNPAEPDTLLVATWERLRDGFDSWPGEVRKEDGYDGYDPIKKWGAGSAIHKTTDGGKTFKKITAGLPTCKMGRIGLDYCRSQPNIVYAIIDCENIAKGPAPLPVFLGAVCQDDKGKTAIGQLLPDSPASQAGLQIGDIVEEVAGKAVKTFDDVLNTLRTRKVGEKISLKYRRGDESKTANVALARRPAAGTGRGTGGGGPAAGGRALSTVYLGIIGEDAPGGARLTQVTEDSPAEKAGLQAGDVIQTVDGKKVEDYQGLLDMLRTRKVGEKLALDVKRGTENKQLAVTLAQRPGAGGGTPTRTRPYAGQLGGQAANIQDQQGSKGYDYGGVYKSTDGGDTWMRVNSLNPRPMYFSQVRVDPSDPSKVYLLGVQQYRSTNGGATFTPDLGRSVHADGHAMWINPRDGRNMLIGSDGGIYLSYDRGAHWDHFNHAAVGQFYHVAVSPGRPYYVYGGLQDNGSWGGPAETRAPAGPINEDWISVGGGDGFTCRVDQVEPDWVYSTSQGGMMSRRNLRTGERAAIRPARVAGQPSFRFNWNAPFILSHHNQRLFYAGAQYVLRSVKRGDDLRVISPELTLTKRGSCTALSESPRNPDILWAGTDDGALWVTRDGGKEWNQVTKNVGLPGPRWVSTIEASRFKEGRAYVVFDAHRSDDDRPYAYVTEDFGKTWKCINSDLPEFGSTRVLREDLYTENLLYCGTEFFVFASIDRGVSWTKLNNNLPTVAIHEIAIHPTAGEIVVATHGRSLWALDVTALRQIKPEQVHNGKAILYRSAVAERHVLQPSKGGTNRRFVGENPVRGAQIWYTVPPKAQEVSLKILDVEGKPVRELQATTTAGLNRITWDLTQRTGGGGRQPARQPARQPRQGGGAGFALGRPVASGTYRVVLAVDGQESSQLLRIVGDAAAAPFRVGQDDD